MVIVSSQVASCHSTMTVIVSSKQQRNDGHRLIKTAAQRRSSSHQNSSAMMVIISSKQQRNDGHHLIRTAAQQHDDAIVDSCC
jgi:RNase P protein component